MLLRRDIHWLLKGWITYTLYKRRRLYARDRHLCRVSTTDQDTQRQLDELREFAEDTYDEPEIHAYADIISGTETDRGDEYQRLRADIENDSLDIVVVHELSRLSRLGAGEIHEFLEFCLSHETGIQELEVGLEISLGDDVVDRAVSQLIAGVVGDIARVEHKRRRIQSAINAPKDAGRWTG
jgi:DNA invertase Pin-like site-specific DNA recombinase